MNEGLIERYQWDVDVSKNADGRTQDANISSAIMLKFAKDDLISSSRINVDTTNGSVTLNGKVSTQLKADRAMQLGRSVEGVKRVRSNLIVEKQ
jgi:osmotically-inducible protein OsmY